MFLQNDVATTDGKGSPDQGVRGQSGEGTGELPNSGPVAECRAFTPLSKPPRVHAQCPCFRMRSKVFYSSRMVVDSRAQCGRWTYPGS